MGARIREVMRGQRLIPGLLFGLAGILLFLLLLSFSTSTDTLGDLAHIAEIVIALALVAATARYFYQKKKDTTDIVIGLLEMLRTSIIPLDSRIKTAIAEEHGRRGLKYYELLSARIESFDVEQFKKRQPVVAFDQSRVFFTKCELYKGMLHDIANALEEFSLRVLNKDAANRAQMDAVAPVYVRAVEEYAMVFMVSAMLPGAANYDAVKALYMKWRDAPSINRTARFQQAQEVVEDILRVKKDKPQKVILLPEKRTAIALKAGK